MEDLQKKFNQELDTVSWSDLVRSFAFAKLYIVEQGLDLVQVATAMAQDNSQKIEAWLTSGEFRLATEDDSKSFTALAGCQFKVLVVSPFVIAQLSD